MRTSRGDRNLADCVESFLSESGDSFMSDCCEDSLWSVCGDSFLGHSMLALLVSDQEALSGRKGGNSGMSSSTSLSGIGWDVEQSTAV